MLHSPVARTNHTDFLGCCHHDFDLQEGAAAGAKTDSDRDTEYLYQTHTHTRAAQARHTLQGRLVPFLYTRLCSYVCEAFTNLNRSTLESLPNTYRYLTSATLTKFFLNRAQDDA